MDKSFQNTNASKIINKLTCVQLEQNLYHVIVQLTGIEYYQDARSQAALPRPCKGYSSGHVQTGEHWKEIITKLKGEHRKFSIFCRSEGLVLTQSFSKENEFDHKVKNYAGAGVCVCQNHSYGGLPHNGKIPNRARTRVGGTELSSQQETTLCTPYKIQGKTWPRR